MSEVRMGSESGQALILFIFVFTVFMFVAAIVFDVGLWVSERQGAAKDADAAALAGAQVFVNGINSAAVADSRLEARELAVLNGIEPGSIAVVEPPDTCPSDKSCISSQTNSCHSDMPNAPWVETKIRHLSPAVFSSFFGITDDNSIGALARACVGSPTGHTGLAPFGVETEIEPANGPAEADCANDADDDADTVVDDGCPLSDCMEAVGSATRPRYGAVCILSPPGHGAGVAGQEGQLLLADSACTQTSSTNLYHDARYGSLGTCRVGDDVNTGTGPHATVLAGIEDRLADEQLCDSTFGPGSRTGYDEYGEVFSVVGDAAQPAEPSADHVFAANNCASDCGPCVNDNASHHHDYMPRVIDLVLVDRFEPTGPPTITGFASFYVIGCYAAADAEATRSTIEADINSLDVYLNRCSNPTGQRVLGIFTRSLAPAIDVDDPNINLPLSIVLVD